MRLTPPRREPDRDRQDSANDRQDGQGDDPGATGTAPATGDPATVDGAAATTPDPATGSAAEPVAAAGRKRRPRWAKVLIALGAVLLVLTLAGIGLSWGLVHRYESQVTHADLLGDEALPKKQRQQHFESGPLNLLLLGSDSRLGEPGGSAAGGQRSDTIMLLHIAASRDKAAIISIPRDSFVNIPAGGGWPGGPNKINAAFAYGGAPLTVKTVTKLTGVPIDGVVIVNFAGIRTMVDAVGGVRVCVDYDVSSVHTRRYWASGCHQMDGAEAEDFVRQRKSVPGGDFGRIKDQQLVIRAIAEKATRDGLLTNPLRLDKLMMTAAKNLTIDKSLNLRQLAGTVRNISPSAIRYATVPYTTGSMQTFAGSSVQLDKVKSEAMFAAIRADTIDQWIADNPSAGGPQ